MVVVEENRSEEQSTVETTIDDIEALVDLKSSISSVSNPLFLVCSHFLPLQNISSSSYQSFIEFSVVWLNEFALKFSEPWIFYTTFLNGNKSRLVIGLEQFSRNSQVKDSYVAVILFNISQNSHTISAVQ